MATSKGWQTETATVEVLRENSNPAEYDVEYSVDYAYRWRGDDNGDLEVEFADYGPIEYQPEGADRAVKMTIADVTPETRAQFDKLIAADVHSTAAGEVNRQADREYFEERYRNER